MMDHAVNLVRNCGHQVEHRTLKGIQTASAESGVSFHYLLAKAAQESGFDSNAKASTSSATGLFQFTRGTWLDMMRRHGDGLGFGDLAAQVKESVTGRMTVLNEDAEIEILALRSDPYISSRFAAFFASDNAQTLETSLGREASPAELYFAHFLSAWGATALVTTAEQDPTKPAVDLLPAAANANKTVFFENNGLARTAAEVIDWLRDKFTDRLSATANVAGLFDPSQQSTPASPAFSRTTTSPFCVGAAQRSGETDQMSISIYLLQMLSQMISALPMQMVDDPFALGTIGFGRNDWGSVLTQAFDRDSAITAEQAYRQANPQAQDQPLRA
ncbi:MAG: transglycosylase SLT domain-containing protein [Rhodospirillaceae bacterium]|nr:transglycosylase SLT domain-containing protein [Rhodospirillaceae bacterium]